MTNKTVILMLFFLFISFTLIIVNIHRIFMFKGFDKKHMTTTTTTTTTTTNNNTSMNYIPPTITSTTPSNSTIDTNFHSKKTYLHTDDAIEDIISDVSGYDTNNNNFEQSFSDTQNKYNQQFGNFMYLTDIEPEEVDYGKSHKKTNNIIATTNTSEDEYNKYFLQNREIKDVTEENSLNISKIEDEVEDLNNKLYKLQNQLNSIDYGE